MLLTISKFQSLPLLTWHTKRLELLRVILCMTSWPSCQPKTAETDTLLLLSEELHEFLLNAQYEQFAFVSRERWEGHFLLKYNDSAFINLVSSLLSDSFLQLPNKPFLYFSEQYFCAFFRLRCFLTAMYFDPSKREHKILFTLHIVRNKYLNANWLYICWERAVVRGVATLSC